MFLPRRKVEPFGQRYMLTGTEYQANRILGIAALDPGDLVQCTLPLSPPGQATDFARVAIADPVENMPAVIRGEKNGDQSTTHEEETEPCRRRPNRRLPLTQRLIPCQDSGE